MGDNDFHDNIRNYISNFDHVVYGAILCVDTVPSEDKWNVLVEYYKSKLSHSCQEILRDNTLEVPFYDLWNAAKEERLYSTKEGAMETIINAMHYGYRKSWSGILMDHNAQSTTSGFCAIPENKEANKPKNVPN